MFIYVPPSFCLKHALDELVLNFQIRILYCTYSPGTKFYIHYYVNEKLLKHFDISNEYLWKHIPKVIRLLKAERIVISQYQSHDLLEVGYYSCGFLLIVYF